MDFHWGDYTYSIAGEREITLGTLLEKLGVTEITAADVAGVSFSNPDYIAIEQLDSDWLLRSLAPFNTEEALTLTLNNSETVTIKVTDEQESVALSSATLELNPNDLGSITVNNLPEGAYFKWTYTPSTILGSGGWDKTTGEGKLYAKKPGSGTATLTLYSDSAKMQTIGSLTAVITVKDVAARVGETEYPVAQFSDAVDAAISGNQTLEVYTSNNRITLPAGQSLKVKAADNRGKGSVIVSAPAATADGAYAINKTTDAETGITTYTCESTPVLVEFTPADGGEKTYAATLSLGSKSGTYKLLGDIPANGRTSVTGTGIVLDLNGHTVSFASGSNYPAITVGSSTKTGGLMIKDSVGGGSIVNDGDIAIWPAYNHSSVTIEGGEIVAAVSAVYTSGGSTAEINCGSFRSTGSPDFLINCKDDNKGTISVNGGTFVDFNPENNRADGANTNYVTASDKIIVENSGAFTVHDAVTVTFDADNGTEAVAQKIVKGSSVAAPEEPAKDGGFIFGGWGTVDGQGNWTEFSFDSAIDADLTLTAKWLTEITVKADDMSMTYGNDEPVLTATVEGLAEGDTINYTLSREAGQGVGSYAISVTGDTAQGNYLVTYKPGVLTVSPRAVTVTADNKAKTFGEGDPELTATVTGLIGEDTISYTLSRAEGQDVGSYVVTPSGEAVQGNYTVSYVPGMLRKGRRSGDDHRQRCDREL